MPFLHATARFRIGSVDQAQLGVEAQYNPKEIQVSQPVGWAVHQPVRNQRADDLFQEFVGVRAQTLQVELLFDFEQSPLTVMQRITALKQLASVRDPHSTNPNLSRPHFCIATWGDARTTDADFPSLRCVIESLSTKYQMFSSTGHVMRATCAITLREADLLRDSANQRGMSQRDDEPFRTLR